MYESLARGRCASQLGIALSAVHAAADLTFEFHEKELRTQLSDLAEELIYLHRQVLQLPPQRSTPLQHGEEQVPF